MGFYILISFLQGHSIFIHLTVKSSSDYRQIALELLVVLDNSLLPYTTIHYPDITPVDHGDMPDSKEMTAVPEDDKDEDADQEVRTRYSKPNKSTSKVSGIRREEKVEIHLWFSMPK